MSVLVLPLHCDSGSDKVPSTVILDVPSELRALVRKAIDSGREMVMLPFESTTWLESECEEELKTVSQVIKFAANGGIMPQLPSELWIHGDVIRLAAAIDIGLNSDILISEPIELAEFLSWKDVIMKKV